MAVVLGFCHVWADHHYLTNADAMSYLDIAEAYLRKDWHTAVSAYWSPLYSWFIALALLAKPSPYWKFVVVHLVNFAIYLFALGCFRFLIHELVHLNRDRKDELFATGIVMLPGWALVAIGYPLFIWSTLYLMSIAVESPDLLIGAAVYLACGLLLRIRRQPMSWVPFALLGITLGLGYLAKSVMLPMAVVFLGASLFSVGSVRRALPRVAMAMALLLLIAGPFVFAMSRAKGRLTFGESGKLNYLWSINQIPAPHWQGEVPGYGKPTHPTRKILDTPSIYEFGDPVGGTYPVWYDPTYWYEGSVSHFDLRQQLRVSGGAARAYYDLLQTWGLQYGLLVGLLSLYLMGRRGWLLLNDLTLYWSLIVPAMAGIGMYIMVNVQGRYVASFVVLLWLSLFSAVRLPYTSESQRLTRAITIVLMAVMIFTVVASSSREAGLTIRQLVAGEDPASHEQWQVAEGLREAGMVRGDKVAFIGDSFRAFWAHLLGLRIVAEIPAASTSVFWEGDSNQKQEVIKTFARTGAKAIVVEKPPSGYDFGGLQRIRNTDYYVYVLNN